MCWRRSPQAVAECYDRSNRRLLPRGS